MGEKNNLVLVVGAIAAFVLQIALAPAVALFSRSRTSCWPMRWWWPSSSPPRRVRCCRLSWACCTTSRARARWAAWRFCWSSHAFWPPACSLSWITTRCSCLWPSLRPARFWPSFPTACCSWRAGLPPTLWSAVHPRLPCALYDCAVGLVVYFRHGAAACRRRPDRGLRTPKLR